MAISRARHTPEDTFSADLIDRLPTCDSSRCAIIAAKAFASSSFAAALSPQCFIQKLANSPLVASVVCCWRLCAPVRGSATRVAPLAAAAPKATLAGSGFGTNPPSSFACLGCSARDRQPPVGACPDCKPAAAACRPCTSNTVEPWRKVGHGGPVGEHLVGASASAPREKATVVHQALLRRNQGESTASRSNSMWSTQWP